MRIFNTSGACIPEEHYTVLRQAQVAQGKEIVAQGRFFTIFAPRQAGKTTYFQLLFRPPGRRYLGRGAQWAGTHRYFDPTPGTQIYH